ncbi:MAG: hypothetical protein SFY95_11435 [Planctomycetota bacterium]|nr:hypothetical protein [Planctomycetota bacterium]
MASSSKAACVLALLAGSVLTGSVLTGCDQQTDATKAIRSASKDIHGVSGGGPSVRDSAERDTLMKSAAGTLQNLPAGASKADAASAQVLLSGAKLGLAVNPAETLLEEQRGLLTRSALIRGMLLDWTSASSRADVAGKFDPSKLLEEIRATRAQAEKNATAQKSKAQDLATKQADAAGRVKARLDEAAAKEAQHAKIQQEAAKLPASQSAPMIENARPLRREADALRKEGEQVRILADQLERQVAEQNLLVEQYTNQKAELERLEAELLARAAKTKQEEAQNRAKATESAAELDKAVQELIAARTGSFASASSAAVKAFQESATAAKTGQADGGATGRVASGVSHQALGDVHFTIAQAQLATADLLEYLAKAEPKLPQADAYASAAQAARADLKTSLDAAGSAYNAAQSAFGGVSGPAIRGELKDRLDSVTAQLETIAKFARGEVKDLSGSAASENAAPNDQGGAAPGEGAPSGAAESPIVLMQFAADVLAAMKESDGPGLMALMHPADDTARQLLQVMGPMTGARAKLDQAHKNKFGTTFSDALAKAPGMGAMMQAGGMGGLGGVSAEALANVTPEQLKVTPAGEGRATLTIPGAPEPQNLVKVDGAWKIEFTAPPLPPGALEQMKPMLGAMSGAMTEIADGIDTGAITSSEAAIGQFMQKVQAAMQGMMGGGGGGGGDMGK